MTSTERTDRGSCEATDSPCTGTGQERHYRWGRRIGPWGTVSRAAAGTGLVVWGLAVPHRHPWLDLPGAGSRSWGALTGLVIIPVALTLAIAARGRSAPRLHLSHRAAWLVTALVILLLQFEPVAVMVNIGGTLLLLAARGRGGCEVLAIPNMVLRRRDYLVCLPFTTLDHWERHRRRASPGPSRPAPS